MIRAHGAAALVFSATALVSVGGCRSCKSPPGVVECFGMHCCPWGSAVVGVRADETFLCAQASEPVQDCFIDDPTRLSANGTTLHACPRGTYVIGWHKADGLLACCFDRPRGYTALGTPVPEFTAPAPGAFHQCPGATGAEYVVGIGDVDHLLCAGAPAADAGAPADPVGVKGPPDQVRSFRSLRPDQQPSPSSAIRDWQRWNRNWLSRILDLPFGDAAVPTVPASAISVRAETPPADVAARGVKLFHMSWTSPYSGPEGSHVVGAHLVLPGNYEEARRGPGLPGVLLTHGHFHKGKDGEALDWDDKDNDFKEHGGALYLAENGVVVLAPDTPSFGEAAMPDEHTTDGLAGDQDHTGWVNDRISRLGWWPQIYALDGMTALSILLEQHVDAAHVSVEGLSLGSFEALLLAALDTRLRGGAMVAGLFFAARCLQDASGGWESPLHLPPGGCHDSGRNHRCQTIAGLAKRAVTPCEFGDFAADESNLFLDSDDLAALVAPRRLMLTWGDKDPGYGNQAQCRRDALDRTTQIFGDLKIPEQLACRLVTSMDHEFDDATAYELPYCVQGPVVRDYATQCDGMHCCPPGGAVVGVDLNGGDNQLLCAQGPPTTGSCHSVSPKRKSGVYSCGLHEYMHGVHLSDHQLECCPSAGLAQGTLAVGQRLEEMPGCSLAPQQVMTGLDPDAGNVTCVESGVPAAARGDCVPTTGGGVFSVDTAWCQCRDPAPVAPFPPAATAMKEGCSVIR